MDVDKHMDTVSGYWSQHNRTQKTDQVTRVFESIGHGKNAGAQCNFQ